MQAGWEHRENGASTGLPELELALRSGKLRAFRPAGGRATVTLGELVDPAGGVNESLFAREEGMASRADTHAKVLHRRTRLVDRAATALDRGFLVFRVDFGLHRRSGQ